MADIMADTMADTLSPPGNGGRSCSAAVADVWSAGVCLYAMLATALPFGGSEETADERRALRSKVCAGSPDGPLLRSSGARDLTRRMLTVDPVARISLADACAHSWVRSATGP